MILNLVLDVNVWVNNYKSLWEGRTGSAAQQLVASAIGGSCRLGEIQPIISLAMLDTLQSVLVRLGFSEDQAEIARSTVEASAAGGVLNIPPIIVIGGGIQPVMDEEDRSVLETAIAGRADLLVTSNIQDFTPGLRSDVTADIVRLGPGGRPDVLLVRNAMLPNGLVIASVPASRAWLVDGVTPPLGLLERFLPPSSAQPAPW